MIKALVYGAGELGYTVKKIISNSYGAYLRKANKEPIEVVGNIKIEDEDITVDIVYDCKTAIMLYNKHDVEIFILPREFCIGQNSLVFELLANNVDINDIYITEKIEVKTYDEFNTANFITPYLSDSYLGYLEYHIADHCNLNCAACEHYSALVEKPVFPIFSKFEQDIKRLKKIINNIGMIRILGGEPLLNKDIISYIKLTRELYPKSDIVIVTNALLLKSMPDKFYDVLKKYHIKIHISYYKPLVKVMPSILRMLEKKEVEFVISDLNEFFTLKQTLKRNPEPEYQFFKCFQARCNNLYDGKIAACFLPFTTKYFNKYFGKQLPEDGAIDLYDERLTLEELKLRLCIPFERCAYCTDPKIIDWRSIKKTSTLEDWVID